MPTTLQEYCVTFKPKPPDTMDCEDFYDDDDDYDMDNDDDDDEDDDENCYGEDDYDSGNGGES